MFCIFFFLKNNQKICLKLSISQSFVQIIRKRSNISKALIYRIQKIDTDIDLKLTEIFFHMIRCECVILCMFLMCLMCVMCNVCVLSSPLIYN